MEEELFGDVHIVDNASTAAIRLHQLIKESRMKVTPGSKLEFKMNKSRMGRLAMTLQTHIDSVETAKIK